MKRITIGWTLTAVAVAFVLGGMLAAPEPPQSPPACGQVVRTATGAIDWDASPVPGPECFR